MKDIRQRMIEDMKLRGLTPCTRATYLEAVKVLARYYNSRLDEITQEQVRDFLLYLLDSKGYLGISRARVTQVLRRLTEGNGW